MGKPDGMPTHIYFEDHLFPEILAELQLARRVHEPMHSAHEAYAVILEEVDEFWEETKKRSAEQDKQKMKNELVQIAAMAVRAIVDLHL